MAQQEHEIYYVPEQSKLPIFASLGLFLTVMGLGNWIMEFSSGVPGKGKFVFLVGLILVHDRNLILSVWVLVEIYTAP